MKSVKCKKCGKEISIRALRCPACFTINSDYCSYLPENYADTHRAEYDFIAEVEAERNYCIDKRFELTWYNKSLRIIVIPDNVKYIPSGSLPDDHYGEFYTPGSTGFFENNQNIEQVFIPGSIKEIPIRAFSSCRNLKKITIQNGVELIGNDAFLGCSSLEEIVFPSSIKRIGMTAFCGCSKLRTLNITKGISVIEAMAFSGCEKLERLTIEESDVPLILYDSGDRRSGRDRTVFSNCPNLKKIILHSRPDLTHIAVSSIFSNNDLEIELDDKCQSQGYSIEQTNKGARLVCCNIIGGVLYEYIGDLSEDFVLDKRIRKIKKGAFLKNVVVKRMLIPSNIENIEIEALSAFEALENIEVEAENPYYMSYNGVLFSKNKEEILFYPPAKKQEIYNVPYFVKTIPSGAFCCGGPTNIFIPDNVESINKNAFNFSLIKKIRYPKSYIQQQ